MWLLVLAFSAAVSTAVWYSMAEHDRYMLKFLSLMLWGATIMVFVDHLMGYLMEGGEFLEISVDATLLGFTLLTAALIVWNVAILIKDPKGVLHRRRVSSS